LVAAAFGLFLQSDEPSGSGYENMLVPLTFVALFLLIAVMIWLRSKWWKLSTRAQYCLLGVGAGLTALRLVFVLSQWGMSWSRMNDVMNWLSVAGFQVLLTRFSLMRPQWLTIPCAVILLTPLLGSSLLLPLTALFAPKTNVVRSIGPHYYSDRDAWKVEGAGNHGYDLVVYYRPPFFPVLQHMVQRFAFNTEECNASESYATVNEGNGTVTFLCPANPGKEPMERVLPLKLSKEDQLR
jgi:hypothetical protein